jgi:integrase
MREKLTSAMVKRAMEERSGVAVWDTSQPGFGLLVAKSGHQSWLIQYKHRGVSRRRNLSGVLDLTAARKEAKTILGAAAGGRDPIGEERKKAREAANTLESVFREYVARDGKKLRSIERQESDMGRLVFPVLGKRPIAEIKRSEIIRLLDRIEDEQGSHMAHQVKAYLSRLCSWHAGRDDDFRSPIVRGMGRVKKSEDARDRILEDHELRALWKAAEADTGPFGPYVMFLLLTAVRRTEASRMTWNEIVGGNWIIPKERMKGGVEHTVPLSVAARAILDRLPRIGPYVFTGDGKRASSGYGWRKAQIDTAAGLSNWRLHDLRRTARSLMSRAGVAPDVAERCLAHAISGVRGTYDRHSYYREKQLAFEALAQQLDRIVNPPADVIVPIPREA